MKPLYKPLYLCTALSAAVFALQGCDPKKPPSAPTPTANSSTPAGVTAAPPTAPVPAAATGTGPAEGSTAVGGMAANQEKGGHKPGSTSAPTGGDGQAAPSAPAPSK